MRHVEEDPDAILDQDELIPDPWQVAGDDLKGDQWWEEE
jgi:hypothetical protein